MSESRPADDSGRMDAPYRELTWEAVALGIFQGIVLNLAFCYAALKLGFSLGGSTVAAIMGYALLRGVLRKGTIVENNINQTIASGINTAGTGVIFTVPALFLLNQKWLADGTGGLDFSPWPLAVAGVAGAILGVVVIVPLRKQMIEMDRLRFPTGVAVTTILRAGSSGTDKARLLILGVVLSTLWKLLMISEWLEPAVHVYLTTDDVAAAELNAVTMTLNRKVIEQTPDAGQSVASNKEAASARPRLRDDQRNELLALAATFFSQAELESDTQRKRANSYYDHLPPDTRPENVAADKPADAPPKSPITDLQHAPLLTPEDRVKLYQHAARLIAEPNDKAQPVDVAGLALADGDQQELNRDAERQFDGAAEGQVYGTRARVIEARGYGLSMEEFTFAFGVIPMAFYPVIYLSLMNLAAGMLAGRGGLPFFAGGVLSWWVISPIASGAGWLPAELSAGDAVGFTYGKMLRPLGIGTLIGGALMGVVMSFPAITSALRSLRVAAKTAGAGGSGGDEMSLNSLIVGLVAGIALFFGASMLTPGVTIGQAVISTVVGTVWLGLAALIVAQATGMTDISPMSGMSLISVTLIMTLMGLTGASPSVSVVGAMVVGVAVCVAIGQGADMMQDLKTGHMIGARPVSQQIVQFASTWLGSLIAMLAVYVLWQDGAGFGPDTPLPAPQGGALAGIIDAVKSGNVPIDKYAAGAAVGATLGAAPMPGLGVLVGLAMYLPFPITFGYGLGCLCQMVIEKIKGPAFCEHKLVPLCAGLIVGEALTGMIHTFIKVGIDKLS